MKAEFFKQNRANIIQRLGGGVIVLTAYGATQRSNDMAFKFQQEANFYYATGIQEPNWQLIIDGVRGKTWLIAPYIDEIHKTFNGSLSEERAIAISGVDAIVNTDEAEVILRDLSKKHSIVYTLGEHPDRSYFSFTENSAQKVLYSTLERYFATVRDCRRELNELRAIKQPQEIAAIKKAIRFTTDAFSIAHQKLGTLKYEYEVEAEFDYYFKKHDVWHAYDPIVAMGHNACTLHYEKNNCKLKKNSLILLDIGASYDGYSADISRTYALGEPTRRQALVHTAVEQSHRQIISLIKPGLSFKEYGDHVDRIMKSTLMELGILAENDEKSYRKYFPHAISHGLGIDVHDSMGPFRAFEPGMVLTVEPGIYIPEEGIGVRIEDNILVTEVGHSNLSARLSTDY
jgi:Xaa-Pro aminopeptidase